MSEPKPLNPTEQDALVKQIGLTLMRAAPEGWQNVVADYRATGRYFELAAEVRSADGSSQGWVPPQEVAALFSRLRAGMHREGRGSWSNARYQLDQPASYNLDFDRTEPKWQTPPPPQAYVDEMRFFPRADENVPEWLRKWLPSGQAPAAPPPPPQVPRGFRTARVFDGAGADGRPSVNRPAIPDHEREALLDYLDRAPVAVAGRGFDADVLDPDAPSVVPVAFQTDGHWIWPAAVGYYLRAYGIPPEAELVERARAAEFRSPEVSEESRVAAAANLGAPTAPRGTPLPKPAVPIVPEPEAEEFSPFGDDRSTQPYDPHATVATPLPVIEDEPPADPVPERTGGQDQATEFHPRPDFEDGSNFFPGDTNDPNARHQPSEDFYPEGGPAHQPPVQPAPTQSASAKPEAKPVVESDENFFGEDDSKKVVEEQFFPEGGAQPRLSSPTGLDAPPPEPVARVRPEFDAEDSFFPEDGPKTEQPPGVEEQFFPEEGGRSQPSGAEEQFFPEGGAQPRLSSPSGLDAPPESVQRSESRPRPEYRDEDSFFPEEGGRSQPSGAEEQFFPEGGAQPRLASPSGLDAPPESVQRSESRPRPEYGDGDSFFPDDSATAEQRSSADENFFPTASAPVERESQPDTEFQPRPDFHTEQPPKRESDYDPESNFFPVEGDSATVGFQAGQDFYPDDRRPSEPPTSDHQDGYAEPEHRSDDEPELLRAEPGPGFQPADDFDAQPVFRTDVDHGFRAEPAREPEAEPADQLVEPRPEPMPVDEPDVEDTATMDLVDLRPATVAEADEVLEFDQSQFDAAQDGPPYRVQFDFDTEPTPPRDDRYRRDSYVDGMDLFAPNRYESAGADQDTAAWSPFAAAGQASNDALPVEPEPEPLPVEEPVAEQARLVESDLVDVVPKFEVEADPRHSDVTTRFEVDQETQFDIEPVVVEQPPAEPEVPRQVTPEEERELSGVRRALDDLDVPPAAYRIGEPVDRTWNLRTEGSSWVVAWFDNGPKNPSRFDRLEDAASFLIGKLVLTGRRAPRRQPPPPQMMRPPQGPPPGGPQGPPPNGVNGFRDGRPMPPQVVQVAPMPRPEPLPRVEPPRPEPLPRAEMPRPEPLPRAELPRPEPLPRVEPPRPEPIAANAARVDAPRQEAQQQSESGGKRGWPIKPMNGEPPLTLFRHKKMVELPAGFEVDRFGEPVGNLVYAAGTPFEERSLVPSWINRAYRVYRLRRPVEVLTGVAVPWFEQPGGGTAYLFPTSVEDMVADGALVEVSHQEAQN
ncbi:TNT domain-containing protein [Umezawaea sp.]|uniref:TNT domain-containing protein n=1 Tax=Umezawaea sp. TaxID=1955258 RepID=UPI002ED5A091